MHALVVVHAVPIRARDLFTTITHWGKLIGTVGFALKGELPSVARFAINGTFVFESRVAVRDR